MHSPPETQGLKTDAVLLSLHLRFDAKEKDLIREFDFERIN